MDSEASHRQFAPLPIGFSALSYARSGDRALQLELHSTKSPLCGLSADPMIGTSLLHTHNIKKSSSVCQCGSVLLTQQCNRGTWKRTIRRPHFFLGVLDTRLAEEPCLVSFARFPVVYCRSIYLRNALSTSSEQRTFCRIPPCWSTSSPGQSWIVSQKYTQA